ncbi:C6 zinc finger domain containing protein [Colletotrichum higginsianum IMI 349063]|uniref:C6 zinc finger domain containing protein n=1 Tax=Colletotrichum higginsianum (strain IMI 349063) TaxID=759273 RepID=A0A1B7YCK8_COLHI|nr:C6 zinc finger domain containing protein [Colletotrichum higginsianum IMI 349063]OBR09654.1 C6 zinc finger domain containing protein [Colletotrichum higginsianum IMI 349063]
MPVDNHRQRPLLPRTAQPPPLEPNATNRDDGNSNGRKRRRSYAPKACDFCRDKKTACDGHLERSQCLRRGLKCEYRVVTDTILKAIPVGFQLVDKQQSLSNADAADLLEILKRVPEDEALEGLRLLRTGNDPALISSALRGYDAGLSLAALNRASLPPIQSSLEFELMMRHPVAYPTWQPFQPSKLDLDFLLLPREVVWNESQSGPTEYVGSLLRSLLTSNPGFRTADSFSPYAHRPRGDSSNSTGRVGPRNPSTVYDNRLLSVDISQWTDVPITNELSLAVLQLYLETDHPMMPLIDVDLLLDGLLGKNEFCSRILVSGLFAWACQGYAAFEPEATVVGYSFYEEAKGLWRRSKEARVEDNICTVAAMHYLLMTSVSLGAGAQYVEFLDDLLDMSKRLELFNVGPSHDSRLDLENSANYRKAKSQIAWVLFACLTFFSTQLHQRLIEHPPRGPLPGDSIHAARDADTIPKEDKRRVYNEVLLTEHCRLSQIVHDVVKIMYGPKQTPCAKAVSLAFAEETYGRLLMWADSLPLELAQGDHCTHHAVIAISSIYHHLAIIDLFRSLLQHNGTPWQRLSTFESEDSTPDAVYAASVKQLQRTVLFYRYNHPESAYSFFWHSALLYLANAMLTEAKVPGHAPDWQFYLRLCIACYQTLYTGFRLAKGITLSLLSMALEKDAMDIPQTRTIRRDLELLGKHHLIPDQVPVYWVVDLDLALTDPFAAHAENLVQRFQKLHLRETSETNES